MKPFTLEWWLEQYDECYFKMVCNYTWRIQSGKERGIMVDTDKFAIEYQRLDRLKEWIGERIVTKYGE